MNDTAEVGALAVGQQVAPGRWVAVAAWLALITSLGLVHAFGCWKLCGGQAALATDQPFLNHDYSFVYYYAVTSKHYLADFASTAGYDPFFMAGHAKSIHFPSSTTLAELVVSLFGRKRPALVYKVFVFASIAALPWLFWLAAAVWLAGLKLQASPLSLAALTIGLFVWYFWTDWGIVYASVGMVSYLLSAPLTLLAAGLLARYVENGRWGGWALAAAATALVWLTHLCSAIALAPGLAAALVQILRRRQGRVGLGVVALPLVATLANSFWIVPGILLWQTQGTTATGIGFINPNVGERLVELFTFTEAAILPILVVACVLGSWPLLVRSRRFSILVSMLAIAFFLGYLAGFFRALDFLQPGRYTLYFFSWGALVGAYGAAFVYSKLPVHPTWLRPAVALSASVAAAALFTHGTRYTLQEILSQPVSMSAELPTVFERLVERINQRVPPGERILFEAKNRDYSNDDFNDPMGHLRLDPLLPLLTGKEVIGGPYLYTHLKTNFTQFGDRHFLAQPGLEVGRFQYFCDVYDIHWIVAWSADAMGFFRKNPDLLESAEAIGSLPKLFLLGKVRRSPRSILPGAATVEPRHGFLQVTAAPGQTEVVLPYHWTPLLACDPPVEIRPYPIPEDPVPLIRVLAPPERFTIYLNPWGWR